jgi:hypothetical protein
VHLGAVFRDWFACLGGGQFGGGAIFIGGSKAHPLVATRAVKAREKVGGQLRTNQIAEVLDAIDIGNGRGDEVACHEGSIVFASVAPRLAQ